MSCPDCNSIKVLTGDPGENGNFGGYSSKWAFDNATAATPAATFIRLNNGVYSAVSEIYVNETNADSLDLSAFLASITSHGSFGYVRLFKEFDSSKFWIGKITGFTDNGSDVTLNVTYIAHNGTFTANDNIVFTFTPDSNTTSANSEVDITLGVEMENGDANWGGDNTYYQPTGYTTLTFTNTSGVTKDYKIDVHANTGTTASTAQGKTDVTIGLFKDAVLQKEVASKITYADAGADVTVYDVRQNTTFFKKVSVANGEVITVQFKTKSSGSGYINSASMFIKEL